MQPLLNPLPLNYLKLKLSVPETDKSNIRFGHNVIRPLSIHYEHLVDPTRELMEKVVTAITKDGIITVTPTTEQSISLKSLMESARELFELPQIDLETYSFGGEKKSAKLKLPRRGFFKSESSALPEISPSQNSGTARTSREQDNPILETVFLTKPQEGGDTNLTPRAMPADTFKNWKTSNEILRDMSANVLRAFGKNKKWDMELVEQALAEAKKRPSGDSLRFIKLPKAPNPFQLPRNKFFTRFEAHPDRNSILTALPKPNQPGLQVKEPFSHKWSFVSAGKNDDTIPVRLIPGHKLSELTDGEIKPTLHRVLGNSAQLAEDRVSVGQFLFPNTDAPWLTLNGGKQLVLPDGTPITEGFQQRAYRATQSSAPDEYERYVEAYQLRLKAIAQYKKTL